MGSLARALETFFTGHGMAMATDQAERLAVGRRQRRIDAVPETLRPTVDAFAGFMMHSRERARRAGTRPRSDGAIEAALAIMRDLARFFAGECGKQDWALTDVHDVGAFLALSPKARKRWLVVLGQFFRFARSRKIVLVDPSHGLTSRGPSGFTGATLTLDQQRVLFRRWTIDPMKHGLPTIAARNTALFGMAGELPPIVISDLFGVHRNTANQWAALAQDSWAGYLAALNSEAAGRHE
ncbi:hypothetical protein [Streptomyces sp. NBC_00063]